MTDDVEADEPEHAEPLSAEEYRQMLTMANSYIVLCEARGWERPPDPFRAVLALAAYLDALIGHDLEELLTGVEGRVLH